MVYNLVHFFIKQFKVSSFICNDTHVNIKLMINVHISNKPGYKPMHLYLYLHGYDPKVTTYLN